MISYELAKELKEAGFPQIYSHLPSPKGGYTQYHTMDVVWDDGLVQRVCFKKPYWEMRDGDKWTQEEMEATDVAKIPTLSELIESIKGDKMNTFSLDFNEEWSVYEPANEDGPWSARYYDLTPVGFYEVGAKTPEEAVANLWLSLHPIKNQT